MIHWFFASSWFVKLLVVATSIAQTDVASLKSAFDSALCSEFPTSSTKTLVLEMI